MPPSTQTQAAAGRDPRRRASSTSSHPRVALGQGLLDQAGATASCLCALHCAICAIAPAALAVLGLDMLLGEETEWALTTVAVLFAVAAMIVGWRRHRSISVALLLGLGALALLGSRFAEEVGLPLASSIAVAAGASLVVGHLLSLRASRRCARACA